MTIKRSLFAASVLMSRLNSLFAPEKHLHNARFAALHELSGLYSHILDRQASLLLGVGYLNQALRVRPTASRRELGNLLIVAPTRGGKGLLAVSQLLTWGHSVVVNDIKGDLFLQTAGFRSRLGKVYVIDPTGIGHRYDPLGGKHTEDKLYSSATQLLHKPNEGEGAIFTQRATVMLTQMLLAARLEEISPFPYVRRLIRLGLAGTASRLNTLSPALSTRFLDINFFKADLTDRFLLSAWGTLTARLQPLLTETVVCSLTHSDFTPEELMCSDQPVTVYIRWKEQDLLALSPLVRLLWGSLIDELITTYDQAGGINCRPVLLLLDEAGRTAIPSLADHATTVVGRGISLWVAIQSLSQLDAVYGKTRATILRDNMESQLYYRPADTQTAKYLEERLGTVSAYARSKTLHAGEETSQGYAERPIPLLSSQQITQLPDTEIIGFHRHRPPLKIKRMDWRDHPALIERRNIPPLKLSRLAPLADIELEYPDPPNPHETLDALVDPDLIGVNP